jgi:hypothetical protein
VPKPAPLPPKLDAIAPKHREQNLQVANLTPTGSYSGMP